MNKLTRVFVDSWSSEAYGADLAQLKEARAAERRDVRGHGQLAVDDDA